MIEFNRKFEPERIKLLIFDLDGTLIDSRLDLIHSVNAMLQHLGRPTLPGDVVASYVGDGAPMLVRRALGDPADEKFFNTGLDYFLDYYRQHKLDYTKIYAGIKEALVQIQATNGSHSADGRAFQQAGPSGEGNSGGPWVRRVLLQSLRRQ